MMILFRGDQRVQDRYTKLQGGIELHVSETVFGDITQNTLPIDIGNKRQFLLIFGTTEDQTCMPSPFDSMSIYLVVYSKNYEI